MLRQIMLFIGPEPGPWQQQCRSTEFVVTEAKTRSVHRGPRGLRTMPELGDVKVWTGFIRHIRCKILTQGDGSLIR